MSVHTFHWRPSEKRPWRAVARGGSTSALARRSTHSGVSGNIDKGLSRPCREGIAPLCLDAERAPHLREPSGKPVARFSVEGVLRKIKLRFPRSRWCGAHSASRQRGAPTWPRNDPRRRFRMLILVMRQASSERACAASSRGRCGGTEKVFPSF